jgi:hypothetical protein
MEGPGAGTRTRAVPRVQLQGVVCTVGLRRHRGRAGLWAGVFLDYLT